MNFSKEKEKTALRKCIKWIPEDEPKEESVINKEIMGIVAPTKFRMFRMQFANALFSEFQISDHAIQRQGRTRRDQLSGVGQNI